MKSQNLAATIKFGLSVGLTALLACALATGQVVKPVTKPVPAKPAPAKPAPAPAKAAAVVKPAAKPAAAPVQPVAVVNPAVKAAPVRPVPGAPTTSTGQTAARVVTNAGAKAPLSTASTSMTTSAAASNTMAGRSNLTQGSAVQSGGDQRSAVSAQGLGTFLYGDWVLTAYGCFRNGTRILCDFDFNKTNGQGMQGTAAWWSDLNLVDDGGKLTGRHTAFFVGDDGSQFPNAYISDKPVRMMIEYDNVSQNYNSVSLVRGTERIDGVPITAIDPSQPAGVMPARAAATGTGAAPAAGATGAPFDKANAALGTVQDTKGKAKSFWQQVKDTANAAKTTANPKQ